MSARPRRAPVVWLGLAAVLVLAAVLALVLGEGGETQAAPVEVEGAGVPALEGAADPAVGASAPALYGSDLDGEAMAIEPGSGPMVLLFLAHWCPVCQEEVPKVQAWIDDGGIPGGVDLLSVATANDRGRPNHPPAEWLEGQGWTPPTLLDDEDSSAASSYGLSGYPFWALIDADGRIVARHAGAVPVDALEDVVSDLAAPAGGR